MTGRRASDWLRALPHSGEENGQAEALGDRREDDRRGGDRRAPKRPIDPKFAATLLAQVLPEAENAPTAYPAKRAPRAGFVVNVEA